MSTEKETYYVKGISCANCAQTFENNLQKINTVENAQVNFGASKITIQGEATVEEIERAGSFENIKVTNGNNEKKQSFSFIQEAKEQGNIIASLLLLAAGILSLSTLGESHAVTIVLFIGSIVVGGHRLFRTGLSNLVRFQFDMKTLMTIAVIGAAIIGEWVEGAAVVILFAISEALESFSMDRARNSIKSLMDISPNTALLKVNNQQKEIHVDQIEVDDVLIVKPGDKIPVDGTVTTGSSSINQAAITGESVPVFKSLDDEVFAGTLNEEGYLEVRATKKANDTTLAKIIHLVEEAQNEKAPAQQFVDRFARYYTPLIMLVALGVALVPPLLFGAGFEAWVYQGLAVLVVGCPCALVVSTPVAIVTAIGNAAKNGVLIKGGAYLETLANIKAVAFDKTGTITKGTPAVQAFEAIASDASEEEILGLAYALESHSAHPLAKAVIQYAESKQYTHYTVDQFQSKTGKGIQGTIAGEEVTVGSPQLFESFTAFDEIQSEVDRYQSEGYTAILIGKNQTILGLLAIADEIRETAASSLEKMHHEGIEHSILLTGDNERTAESIAKQAGIKHYLANLLPKNKQEQMKRLKEKYGGVAMVGDGVNDAPALASADIGIAMGQAGTDTALETADIALMGDELGKLPYTIKLSHKTLTNIKQNITFALGLKLLALLLVIPGWLTLWIAILADLGATLLVTLNALRLLKVK